MAWLVDSHGQVLASLILAHSLGWSMRAGLDLAMDLGTGLILWPGFGRAGRGVAIVLDTNLIVRRVRELRPARPWLMISTERVVVLPRHVIALRAPSVGDRMTIRS
ncbi:MAG: hypothetical protein MP439_07695 [Ferrimicrobium sp.]|jgi:hypothetical protein|nr:hypothetical protein [Ferrimicrobium sp.]